MTRALNKYVLFIRLRWAQIMRSRGADKVTRREFIEYARQVAAEYQYLKLTDQLDQALVGAVTVNTEPKPTHHNCTQTSSYSISTKAINTVPSRYDAAIQTQHIEQKNKTINVKSKKKEKKQERSYLYTYQVSPDQSEESLPITRHADDELSDSSSEDYNHNTAKQQMEEQYFKFMTQATQMAFESMNQMYLMGMSKSKTMTQMTNKLQPVESKDASHLYNTKGPSPFTSFDSLRPTRDTIIIDDDNWSEVKDDISKPVSVNQHTSTKANFAGVCAGVTNAATSLAGAAATLGKSTGPGAYAANEAIDETCLGNHAATADITNTEQVDNQVLQGDTNAPYNTYNPSPFTSFDSIPQSVANDKTNAKASKQTSITSRRQTSKRKSRKSTTIAAAAVATTAATATAAGVVATKGASTPTAAMPSFATPTVATIATNPARIAEPTSKHLSSPANNATVTSNPVGHKPELGGESMKPNLPEADHREMTIASDALFSDGVDGLNEHTNIVQISSHVMRSMMSVAKSEELMNGGDFLLDKNDTKVIDQLIDESTQLSNETIIDSLNNDEAEKLLAARYGTESMTETISSIVKSLSLISQKELSNTKRESTLISVSDMSSYENNEVKNTHENTTEPEYTNDSSDDNNDVSLGDIDLDASLDLDDDNIDELSENDAHPAVRVTHVSDPPLSQTNLYGPDSSEDDKRMTLQVPTEVSTTKIDDDELFDDFSVGTDSDEDDFSVGTDLNDDDAPSLTASADAVHDSKPTDEAVLVEDEPAKKSSIFGKIRRSIRSVLRRESKEMKEKDGTFEERNGFLTKAQRQSCSIQ